MDKTLHIKGQMVFMGDWEQILFLACPIMKDLNNLLWSGLFVNDLRYKMTVQHGLLETFFFEKLKIFKDFTTFIFRLL